ncbi:MAG: permease, partial [Gemmatimonadetes bacterium]
GRIRQRVRALLVGTEVALSVVLLAGALLLLLSLSSLWSVHPGFEPARVWVAQMSLPPEKYGTAASAWSFEAAVRERLAGLPGVTAVATASSPPFERGLNTWVNGLKDGRPLQTYVESRLVSPGYFETLSIPILRGRPLGPGDGQGAAPVVVVSASLARVYWPDSEAVGRRLGGAEVVGVAGDVRSSGFDRPAPPMVYAPAAQASDQFTRAVNRWFLTSWLVKSARPLDLRTVAGAVAEVDPGQPVVSVRRMEDVMAASLGPRRFVALLLELFAALAVLLAAVGIYGVVSYAVSRRRREFGLRVALGATAPDVTRLVLRQGLRLAVVGAGAGILGALVLTRFLQAFLYGVHPTNPLAIAGAAMALVAVAVLACFVPARRATHVDPMIALRAE